jgi:hypothetical protein
LSNSLFFSWGYYKFLALLKAFDKGLALLSTLDFFYMDAGLVGEMLLLLMTVRCLLETGDSMPFLSISIDSLIAKSL